MLKSQKMSNTLKLLKFNDVNDISINTISECLLRIPTARWHQKSHPKVFRIKFNSIYTKTTKINTIPLWSMEHANKSHFALKKLSINAIIKTKI